MHDKVAKYRENLIAHFGGQLECETCGAPLVERVISTEPVVIEMFCRDAGNRNGYHTRAQAEEPRSR